MQNLSQLAANPAEAGVVSAIRQASDRSGVDFTYLLQKASTESSLDPNAHAATSSASGLFQFIDQTWLTEMARHGAEYGLANDAAAIHIGADGHASVGDSAMRQQIMALKNDPTVAAEMAASFTKDNQNALEAAGIGSVGRTELYLAHFLGAGGAVKFLTALRRNPGEAAASILPQAADANEPVFFHADGTPRSLGEIYNRFAAHFGGASGIASSTASAAYAMSSGFGNTSSQALDATEQWGSDRASLYEMMLLSEIGAISPEQEAHGTHASQSL